MPLRAGSPQKTAPKPGSKPPYGLSFSLEELIEAKERTERSNLSLSIVLDHVIDGTEFEEVLVIGTADNEHRILTIWNTGLAIHAQSPQGRPRAYTTMAQALDSIRSKSSRRPAWRFFQS